MSDRDDAELRAGEPSGGPAAPGLAPDSVPGAAGSAEAGTRRPSDSAAHAAGSAPDALDPSGWEPGDVETAEPMPAGTQAAEPASAPPPAVPGRGRPRLLRERSTGPAPIHPLLLAAFPVLFLFAENSVQQVTLDPLWQPLILTLLGTAAVWLLASAVLRDPRRGAFLTSVLVALFFSFGHVWTLIQNSPGMPTRPTLGLIYGVVAVAGLLLAWRGGRWLGPATRGLNVIAVLLVAFNVVRIGEFAFGLSRSGTVNAASAAVRTAPDITEKRDIYYLIFDRYSNTKTLGEIYGFDNSPFLDELRERGFSVAEKSWANYFKTALSLVSSLSMDYLPAEELLAGPNSFEPLHQMLRNRLAVPATLRSLGYEYLHIGNHWEPSAENVDADRVLRFANGSEFANALVATTWWGLTEPLPEKTDLTQVESDTIEMGYREMTRAHTLYAFDRLNEAIDRPGPTYVFAHILLPHTPWRFNADGSFPTAEELSSRTNRESYLQQLQYANKRILEFLDRALDKPPDEQPIIILQADEGEFPERFAADQVDFDWLHATPEEIQHKFGILNAMYLPGVDDQAVGFGGSVSPVNEFRIVFNAYFGTGLPLLEDHVWLSPNYRRIFEFHEYQRPDG
jgi:Sulfatase